MSIFERYLTLWVFLCIIVGVVLGQFLPVPFHWLGELEVAKVNIPVGLLIWVMIIPMLLRIDFGALHEVGKLMHAAGFRVLEVSGGYHTRGRFFGNQSRHIIVLAERKDPASG